MLGNEQISKIYSTLDGDNYCGGKMKQGKGLAHLQMVALVYRIIRPHQERNAWERPKKEEGARLMDIQRYKERK